MKNRLPFLAQHVLNTPLAIHPQKAEIIMLALADRFGVAHVVNSHAQPAPLAFYGSENERVEREERDRPYDLEQGVAVISIEGTLAHKVGWIDAMSGMTGYLQIREAFQDALADPGVRAIVLDIDSPGGEVSGCFDLADLIYDSRGKKPIWAILTECAYSAAYAIASAADIICIPRTGGAGSIGVIAMLADLSRATDKAGITVNIITFGARKADGNPYEPLADEARTRFQAQIDAAGELFVATVARNRGLSAEAVRNTEAACFGAEEAINLGLVDAIAAPDVAFAELLKQLT
jgi:signal peptide peptidase SppA